MLVACFIRICNFTLKEGQRTALRAFLGEQHAFTFLLTHFDHSKIKVAAKFSLLDFRKKKPHTELAACDVTRPVCVYCSPAPCLLTTQSH